ncbi:MAG: response regulator [Geminicoccaceae bacterium]|nr:response regulator [Geminicoccaceae bacterium]
MRYPSTIVSDNPGPAPVEPSGQAILMIEDDYLWRRVFDRKIGEFAEISWVSTIRDAGYELDNYAYGGLIADLGLPDSTPDQTISSLDRLSRRLPTIVVSGNAEAIDHIEERLPGLRGAIFKPDFDAPLIRRWIASGFSRIAFQSSNA